MSSPQHGNETTETGRKSSTLRTLVQKLALDLPTVYWRDDPVTQKRQFRVTNSPHAEEIERRLARLWETVVDIDSRMLWTSENQEELFYWELEMDGLIPRGTCALLQIFRAS